MHRPGRHRHRHHSGGVSKGGWPEPGQAAAGDVGHLPIASTQLRGSMSAEAGDIRQPVGAKRQLDHSGAGLPTTISQGTRLA